MNKYGDNFMKMTAGKFISQAQKIKPDFDANQLAYYRTKMKEGIHYEYLTPKLIVYKEQALLDLEEYLKSKESVKFGSENEDE